MASPGRQYGFTLLEVLVALVIVALGLIAAFGQVNQTITTASRLRDKTIAHWVAMNEMTRLRLKGEFPATGSRSDEVEMARTTWRYTIKVVKTEMATFRRVDISVSPADEPDAIVTTVSGLLASSPQTQATQVSTDWPPPASE
ncbi:MAG: type II secretion system minor pseudopilin GspI [Gammaproteobacteria bacterium]|nr:type II secretion system minor pseudopilin GspI [Gammaproteobacteria bacterium]